MKEIDGKRILISLICFVALIAVAIFAGCIGEDDSPTLDTIKIDITSTTWRDGEKPYNIYAPIERSLKKAGFKVVPKENGVCNATLFVNYREEIGDEYYEEFGKGTFAGYGTDIVCYIQFNHNEFGLLFTEDIKASTQVITSDNLYKNAVQNFENKVYFKYIGEIIASKYNTNDELSVLISALINDKNSDIRSDAANVLGEIGDERAVDPLIGALMDAKYTVRWNAAEALGKIGDTKAVEPLIATFKVEDDYLRARAAEALGAIGDEKAVEPLISVLDDEDQGVRSSAAEALGAMGAARAVEPLINALNDEEWSVRSSAARALGWIGDARAVGPLTTALNDESEYVRSSAETALENIRIS